MKVQCYVILLLKLFPALTIESPFGLALYPLTCLHSPIKWKEGKEELLKRELYHQVGEGIESRPVVVVVMIALTL